MRKNLGMTMEETHFKIKIAPDHVQRLWRGTPSPAISELVCNSLDAGATKVQVNVLDDGLGAVPFQEAG